MNPEKRARLEAAGWSFGDAEDFLELNKAERMLVELRSRLGAGVRRLRTEQGITQKGLAALLETSQPRVVDIEASAASLDMMVRAFYVLGGELPQLAELGAPIAKEERKKRVTTKPKAVPKATTKRKAATGR